MTFKPFLSVSVLAVISAFASGSAFASDQSSTFCKPGFYAGIQGGRSDTFYSGKTFIHTAAPTHSQEVVSLPFSTTTTTTDTSEILSGQKVDDIGIGGRIYAGYQFNPYFAVETGFTQYAKTSFSTNKITSNSRDIHTTTPRDNFIDDQSNLISNNLYAGEITENAVDLVGKATLPLNYGFGLYVKAGAAYINANRHTNSKFVVSNKTDTASSSFPPGTSTTTKETSTIGGSNTDSTKSYQAVRPVAGIGVNYSIPNSNISVDGSYSRVFSSGAIPQASLLALGLEYKFS